MSFKFTPVVNKFTPRYSQAYYFIGVGKKNALNLLIGKRTWTGDKFDRSRLSMNNVYPSLEAAKTARTLIVAAVKTAQSI